MKKPRKQEQVNTDALPKWDETLPEFTLEDILAEFGGKSSLQDAPPAAPEAAPAQDAPSAQQDAAAQTQPTKDTQDAPAQKRPPHGRTAAADAPHRPSRFQFIRMENRPAQDEAPQKAPQQPAQDAPHGAPHRKAAEEPARSEQAQAPARPADTKETARAARPHGFRLVGMDGRPLGAPRTRDVPHSTAQAAGSPEEAAAPSPKPDPFSHRRAPEQEAAPHRPPRPVRLFKRTPQTEPEPTLQPDEAFSLYRRQLGTGRLRVALCGVPALFSLLLVLFQQTGWLSIGLLQDTYRLSLLFIGMMLLAAVLCYDTLALGVMQLLQFKPQLHALLAVTVLVGTVDSFRALRQARLPYSAAITLAIFIAGWSEVCRKMALLNTLQVARHAEKPRGIYEVPAVYGQTPGLRSAEGDLKQFMRSLAQPDYTQKIMRVYAPAALLLCAALAALIRMRVQVSFLWVLTVLLLGSLPLGGFLAFSRPYYRLSRRLARHGAAVCGWEGARAFEGTHAILIGDEDIFPKNSVSLNGMKMLPGWPVAKVVGYAAAAVSASGSALGELFEGLLQAEGARHYPVDKYRYYESGGIGAEIMGDIVLLGSLDFMKAMGVHMQGGSRIRQAVYVSVNGELAGIFALKYQTSDAVLRGLNSISHLRHFSMVLATRDFVVNPGFVKHKFGIPADRLIFPSLRERVRLSEQSGAARGVQGAILTQDNFGAFADAAAGGRVLKSAVQSSTWISVAGGLCGILLMALMAWLHAVRILNVGNLLLVLLLWALPCLLIHRWASRY